MSCCSHRYLLQRESKGGGWGAADGGGAPAGVLRGLGAEDLELPDGVAVAGRALGAVDTHVPAAADEVDRRGAAGAGGGGGDRGPGHGLEGNLGLGGPGVGGFPLGG